MPFKLARPGVQELDQLLSHLRGLAVTYPQVGATREDELPIGYRHDRYRVPLGSGETVFQRGRKAIRSWEAHRYAGATITPASAPLVVGTDVVVTLRVGPVFALAPCRIVYVTDDDDEFGFGYGTLPGHPERGEEAFRVIREADDQVSFRMVVFSRPADRFARVGSPVARAIQTRVTTAYLEGVRRYVAADR